MVAIAIAVIQPLVSLLTADYHSQFYITTITVSRILNAFVLLDESVYSYGFRQKLKRLQLEQQVRELETKLSKMALAQAVSVESSLRNTHQSQLEIEVSTKYTLLLHQHPPIIGFYSISNSCLLVSNC